MSEAKEKIEQVASDLGLVMEATFVPWKQSRNKAEKQPSLNWSIRLHRGGALAVTTDYMAGMGHCPSYKQGDDSLSRRQAIDFECNTGSLARASTKPIKPELADVLHSLVSDAGALDYADFDSWASEFGYDTDSRKAEAIYKACLQIGLCLRALVGEEGLKRLQEACQDY